jgi:hypothetical protein
MPVTGYPEASASTMYIIHSVLPPNNGKCHRLQPKSPRLCLTTHPKNLRDFAPAHPTYIGQALCHPTPCATPWFSPHPTPHEAFYTLCKTLHSVSSKLRFTLCLANALLHWPFGRSYTLCNVECLLHSKETPYFNVVKFYITVICPPEGASPSNRSVEIIRLHSLCNANPCTYKVPKTRQVTLCNVEANRLTVSLTHALALTPERKKWKMDGCFKTPSVIGWTIYVTKKTTRGVARRVGGSPGGRGAGGAKKNRQVGAFNRCIIRLPFSEISTSLRFEDKKRGRVNPV